MPVRICLAAVLAAAVAAPRAGAAEAPRELAARARAVLKAHCSRCHSGDGSSSGYAFDVTKHETLVKPVGDDEPVVVPNSLEKSALWKAVQKRMPQKGSPEREAFGDEQRQALQKWIVAGAPPFPAASDRPFLTLRAVLTAVRDHLRRADSDTRPFLRYFSLAHVHNNPAVSDEDLRYYRAALSKVVNSLSGKPRVAVPEAIDPPAATVFVVDVRDLDWDRADLWRRVIEAYPYGLRYGSHPDRELKELDREIVDLTKCDLPWVRGDWFVATASRPPLYHDLLQLPKNARDLERRLGVEVADNFRDGKLVRAGFSHSGVSGQNRLLERHDAPNVAGAYWKSYDFLPDNGRGNLTRLPLGPLDLFPKGRHPFAAQAFKQDGGEIIFNLPNGLQGYLLVNAKDERIDTGPIAVVSDDRRVSGTPEIVTGVSCMACHSQGMIGFKDFLRDHSAVFGDAEKKVKQLYPEPKVLNNLVEADRRRFVDSLEKAVGPFLRVGPDKEAPLARFKEPVAEVVLPYRRGYLDLKAVALELFVENPDDLVKKVGEKRFKELGLEALTRPGGVVGRLEWEAVDGYSLMQEVARELRFTPFGR
jgi:serine/threonine-protein kinase